MSGVLVHLESHRERLGLDALGLVGPLTSVVVTPRFRASSHVVHLILASGSQHAALVAKVPRLRNLTGPIEREAQNLAALAEGAVAASVPRLLGIEHHDGWPMLLQTALAGEPLDRPTTRRDPDRWVRAARDWLGQLTADGCPDDTEDADDWCRVAEKPLADFARICPLQDEERVALDETRSRVGDLRTLSLPRVFEHGDLSHPNVLRLPGGTLGVLDWELAERRGPPACDLFFFLAYVAFARDQCRSTTDYLRAFEEAFFGRTAWARPYVLEYADGLGLTTDALDALFLMCWARYVARVALRLGEVRPEGAYASPFTPLTPATAEWLRGNRYFLLWRFALGNLSRICWKA